MPVEKSGAMMIHSAVLRRNFRLASVGEDPRVVGEADELLAVGVLEAADRGEEGRGDQAVGQQEHGWAEEDDHRRRELQLALGPGADEEDDQQQAEEDGDGRQAGADLG